MIEKKKGMLVYLDKKSDKNEYEQIETYIKTSKGKVTKNRAEIKKEKNVHSESILKVIVLIT